jgi:hypothetical protein
MKYLLVLVALLFTVSGAEARKRHRVVPPQQNSTSEFNPMQEFLGTLQASGTTAKSPSRYRTEERSDAIIIPHPAGCPRRAFCGCGASVRKFGRPIRELFLARAWFKFPEVSAAPGMVAVRRHHVFVIEAVLGNGLVRAWDANSGRGLTRIHTRSLAGYSVRNPNA